MVCPDIQKDMNGDGIQTISDILAAVQVIYHWPGDFILELMLQSPETAQFLELSLLSCGGWLAFGISTAIYLTLLLGVITPKF